MRQTKQQLQTEIERLRARLAAFGISEEMEPGKMMLVTNVHTFGLNFTAPLTTAPIWPGPDFTPCSVCGKPANTFLTPGGTLNHATAAYCQEHSAIAYTNRVTTDGKPIY